MESDTETVKAKLPIMVGSPDISPSSPLRVRFAGKSPADNEKEYGGVPPTTSTRAAYAEPTVAAGRTGEIAMLSTAVVASELLLPKPYEWEQPSNRRTEKAIPSRQVAKYEAFAYRESKACERMFMGCSIRGK